MSTIEKYPNDFQEFLHQFSKDEDYWDYLFEIRCPNGFACPNRGGKAYYLMGKRLIYCN